MNCQSCADVGIIRVPWNNAPDDFAICLCAAGADMRSSRSRSQTAFALWQLWAARGQIDPSRVFLLEEILTPPELAQRGFVAAVQSPVAAQESVLLAVGKRKVKL